MTLIKFSHVKIITLGILLSASSTLPMGVLSRASLRYGIPTIHTAYLGYRLYRLTEEDKAALQEHSHLPHTAQLDVDTNILIGERTVEFAKSVATTSAGIVAASFFPLTPALRGLAAANMALGGLSVIANLKHYQRAVNKPQPTVAQLMVGAVGRKIVDKVNIYERLDHDNQN